MEKIGLWGGLFLLLGFVGSCMDLASPPDYSNGSPPSISIDKYEKLISDDEKFIYEYLILEGYSHDEAIKGVVNSR